MSLNEKNISMQLKFSKEVFYRVYDEFNHDDIINESDESILIETILPETDWLINYLLSFGSYLKVLSPRRIQNEIRKEAILIYENTWRQEDFK